MTNRDIGLEILEGIKEIKAHKTGQVKLKTTTLSEPSPPNVAHKKINHAQSTFTSLGGVSLRIPKDRE